MLELTFAFGKFTPIYQIVEFSKLGTHLKSGTSANFKKIKSIVINENS